MWYNIYRHTLFCFVANYWHGLLSTYNPCNAKLIKVTKHDVCLCACGCSVKGMWMYVRLHVGVSVYESKRIKKMQLLQPIYFVFYLLHFNFLMRLFLFMFLHIMTVIDIHTPYLKKNIYKWPIYSCNNFSFPTTCYHCLVYIFAYIFSATISIPCYEC